MIKFPLRLLQPLRQYLMKEEKILTGQKERLDQEDPFKDSNRELDNAAVDTEVAELVGHERVSVIKMEIDKALVNVRKTLTRIKLGKYGTCVSCGKMIDTDRLAINPTAEYCVTCEKARRK